MSFTSETMRTANVVIALLTDLRAWIHTANVLMQLNSVKSTLPRVVFYGVDSLPEKAVNQLNNLRAVVKQVKPFPLPPNLAAHLSSKSRECQWQKLGLWSHTEYQKIIFLDSDILVLENIDEMRWFPADTFSPNVCTQSCNVRVGGVNTGTMVLKPSHERFSDLVAYSWRMNEKVDRLRALLSDVDQSFIINFFKDVLNISITASPLERDGYHWTQRSFRDRTHCKRHMKCGGTVNIMSRRYNARPGDCDRCPASYSPKIVHFACAIKPWWHSIKKWQDVARGSWHQCGSDRYVCSPCIGNLTLKWYSFHKLVVENHLELV